MVKKITSKSILGFVFAFFCVFVWGITFVSTKSLLNDFSALEILVIRFLFAYIMLWILCPKVFHVRQKKDELLFFVAGLCGVTIYQFLENVAIMFSTASNVSIIVSICPIFAALFAQIFLHEKHITHFFIVGFILAILGVSFVSFNGRVNFHFNPLGDFLALCSAISWGFYTLFVTKINERYKNKLAATRRIFFYAFVCMIPLIIYGTFFSSNKNYLINFNIELNIIRFSKLLNVGNLMFLGLFASALCFVAWNVALENLGSVRVTEGVYLIPVVTIVFAFFTLGEKITPLGIVGTLLTICGLVLSNIKVSPYKKQQKNIIN